MSTKSYLMIFALFPLPKRFPPPPPQKGHAIIAVKYIDLGSPWHTGDLLCGKAGGGHAMPCHVPCGKAAGEPKSTHPPPPPSPSPLPPSLSERVCVRMKIAVFPIWNVSLRGAKHGRKCYPKVLFPLLCVNKQRNAQPCQGQRTATQPVPVPVPVPASTSDPEKRVPRPHFPHADRRVHDECEENCFLTRKYSY
jgi:hypothetical protein